MKTSKHQQWRKKFPYYKVQYWDDGVLAWHDIQKTHNTIAEANKQGKALSKKYRIMVITRESRKLL